MDVLKAVCACTFSLLALGACSEVAYQSGAGPDQLKVDQTGCKATNDYGACMAARGWKFLSKGANAPKTAEVAAQASLPAAVPASDTKPTKGAHTSTAPALTTARMTYEPIVANGWARSGGGSASGDIRQCVTALGESHRPNYTTHIITPEFAACMKDRGWTSFQ